MSSNFSEIEPDIFSNKSSVIVEWLLKENEENQFSIREIAKSLGLSLGLVQKIIKRLVYYGGVLEEGKSTSKVFRVLDKPRILSTWIKDYNILKKCKTWSYNFGAVNRGEILKRLQNPKYAGKVALALHSAAEALGYKSTNLKTLELYILDETVREELEQDLDLCSKKTSLNVILIKPYYPLMLTRAHVMGGGALCTADTNFS